MKKVVRVFLALLALPLVLLPITAFIWLSPYSPYQFGNYVPSDIYDAHTYLEQNLPEKELKRIRDMKSDEEMIVYHHGLGMGLRNQWGLWGGSRLSRYFHEMGIDQPDDMTGIILTTFWRKLQNRPLDVDQLLVTYNPPERRQPTDSRTPAGEKIGIVSIQARRGIKANDDTRFSDYSPIHYGKSSDGKLWIFVYGKGFEPMSAQLAALIEGP